MLVVEVVMTTYPPIEDHCLIGDLQTAAPVAIDGTIDWCRAPRFESPSIFAALLDQRAGAHFMPITGARPRSRLRGTVLGHDAAG